VLGFFGVGFGVFVLFVFFARGGTKTFGCVLWGGGGGFIGKQHKKIVFFGVGV